MFELKVFELNNWQSEVGKPLRPISKEEEAYASSISLSGFNDVFL